jgi:hypothetical protein
MRLEPGDRLSRPEESDTSSYRTPILQGCPLLYRIGVRLLIQSTNGRNSEQYALSQPLFYC